MFGRGHAFLVGRSNADFSRGNNSRFVCDLSSSRLLLLRHFRVLASQFADLGLKLHLVSLLCRDVSVLVQVQICSLGSSVHRL